MDNIRDLYEQKKNEQIDPYGFSHKAMNSEECKQTTPYDGFLFEDCLRYISASDTIGQLKEKMEPRKNKETGLYEVTVGDGKSDYYFFATMFNRMTNDVYAKKVYRSAKLLIGIIDGIKRDYTELVEESMKSAEPLHIHDSHFP